MWRRTDCWTRCCWHSCLGELPERDRELIRMRYFQNKTQTEIAGILGISQVQVSRLEKKILREMREMAG